MRVGVDGFLQRWRATGETYREFAPAPDLRSLVACTWVKVLPGSGVAGLVPIIPDGCSDVMTYDDGAPFVVGPDPVTRWTALPEGLVITGLRLRPGAVRSLLRTRANELLGARVELVDLDRAARPLRHALDGAAGLPGRIAALEAWARARVERVSDRDLALVSACRTLADEPRATIDGLARELGFGVRTLHREIVATCGYGPKLLQRIMRVQRALRVWHGGGPRLRLSDVAVAAGFADQAHMTRDFGRITGFAPSAYLQQQSEPELGRWIDGDLQTM